MPFCILEVENICSLLKVGFCSTGDLMVAYAHKNASFSSSLTRFNKLRMLVLSRMYLYNGTSSEVPFCILEVENICSLLKVGFCSTHDRRNTQWIILSLVCPQRIA